MGGGGAGKRPFHTIIPAFGAHDINIIARHGAVPHAAASNPPNAFGAIGTSRFDGCFSS